MTAAKYRSLRKTYCDSNLGYVCGTTDRSKLNLLFKDGNSFNTSVSNLVTVCNHCLENFNVLRECTA